MERRGMCENHLLAIPVFNEERYVARVLAAARLYSEHILVIDDGSTDRTPGLLQSERNLPLITHPDNRGYGKSLADAFDYARRNRYEWLITMDCDEQHEPSHLPEFLSAAARDRADIISGTRYPNGHQQGAGLAPADRRDINRRITKLLNETLDLSITDAFCGFKAYRVAALKRLRITIPGYAMPMQFWIQVARAGLRVEELPVPLIYNDPTRSFGEILDNPATRLQHYLDVFEGELQRDVASSAHLDAQCISCR